MKQTPDFGYDTQTTGSLIQIISDLCIIENHHFSHFLFLTRRHWIAGSSNNHQVAAIFIYFFGCLKFGFVAILHPQFVPIKSNLNRG